MKIYCTTQQAADLFHIPASTIRRWSHEGRLSRHGTPQRAVYDLAELSEVFGLLREAVNANMPIVGEVFPPHGSPPSSHLDRRGVSMNGDHDATN